MSKKFKKTGSQEYTVFTCRYSQPGTAGANCDGLYENVSQSGVFKLKPLQAPSRVHCMAH